MFSRSGNTKRLVGILSNVWARRKSKMAAINRKYIGNNVQLVYMIAKKFQRLYPCFQDRATRLDYCKDRPTCRLVVI